MKRSTLLKYAILVTIGYLGYHNLPWRDDRHLYNELPPENKRNEDVGIVGHHRGKDRINELLANGLDKRVACETVHVLMICDGSVQAREFGSLVKTLMFYRKVPLHFHVISDEVCSLILNTLFNSWETVHLTSSFYTKKRGSALSHVVHEYLPSFVEKVICLHHNVRFLTDISQLWHHFVEFTEFQFLGIVPNTGTEKIDFFTDILLLRLDLIRKSRPLVGYFENHIRSRKIGSIAAGGIYHLPCSWRLDLTNITFCQRCLSEMPAQASIWNTKSDTFMKSALIEEIKERLTTVLETSPYSVPHDMMCSSDSIPRRVNSEETMSFSEKTCLPYRYAARMKRRTHLYYLGSPLEDASKDKNEITLLTQLTMDRFTVFEKFINNWEGPVAAVFHVSDWEANQLPKKVASSQGLKNRTNIAYHVVYKRQKYYPINYLRNVALNETNTPYALFVDVDLVPSPGIYPKLKKLVAHSSNKRSNITLVIPAFEALEELQNFPVTKQSVLEYMKQKKVVGYRMNRGWNLGHRPTDFNKWQIADEPYKVQWKDAFEPYVIMKVEEGMPKYHEGLLERMGDKIAYGREIYARGFEFWVVPDVYVIHLPHPTSEGTQLWQKEAGYMRCGSILITEFKTVLKTQHPNKSFK